MGQCYDSVSRALVSINRNLHAYVILDKVFPTFLENFGGARFWKNMLKNYMHAATINTAVIAKTWSHPTHDSRELKASSDQDPTRQAKFNPTLQLSKTNPPSPKHTHKGGVVELGQRDRVRKDRLQHQLTTMLSDY